MLCYVKKPSCRWIADRTASQHLWGCRGVIVTWPFDTPCHFLLVVLWNGVLFPAVFKILQSKRIGVTSLTFQSHMNSSVTWPFDSPYAISYRWSFGTKPLSLTVFEIFVECNSMVDMTLVRPLNIGQGHSFWYQSIRALCCAGHAAGVFCHATATEKMSARRPPPPPLSGPVRRC